MTASLAGLVLLLLIAHGSPRAQPVTDTPPALRSSRMLSETIGREQRERLPSFVSGERITTRTDLETVVEGQAQIRRGDTVLRADRLEYFQPDDTAKARGNVRINRAGDTYEGPALELKISSFEGFFVNPRYRFLKTGGHGEAARVDFIDADRAVIRDASYTTCRRLPGPSWMPDWVLRAASISIDNEEEVGQAEGAVLSFKGVPVMAIPALSFPLSGKRKSGFLPPSFGVDNVNGLELSVPYYWNIAPNRDATLFPAVLTKRGVDLAGEFRYLESDYSGQIRANYLPDDRLRSRDRWGLALSHGGSLPSGLDAVGDLSLSLSLNRVSDDDYWRDFTRVNPWLTQRLLANDLSLGWGRGPWSVSLRALRWQTLQDATSPIVPPYDRMPQLRASYRRAELGGFDLALSADSTRFESDPVLTGQPNGRRSHVLASVGHTWSTPGSYVTPRLKLHATHYEFDAPLANGARAASRALPTLSVDAGLVFEREASFFGRGFLQTLEPRAYYVHTPFRDQSLLPNYDSGLNDFSFATIFADNAFVGNDRIADNHLLTIGATTRLLDPASGAEAARFSIAQRIRFRDQRVTLPGGATVPKGLSDVLLGASVNVDPRWTLDSTVQFDPDIGRSVRSTIGGRYSPGNYRVVSAAYRLQRGASEQIDIGWQWPLNDLWGDRGQDLGAGRGQGEGRWYSVGRMNFSLREGRLVDSLVGIEYDGGCWIGRVVLERLQTGRSSANQRIMFQLEFVGFSRLGVNPLQTLRQNIPRYQFLRESVQGPSRFSNYD